MAKNFNKYEEKILKVLGRKGRHVSITELALETGISRQTVKKYIERLYRRGFLERT